MKMEENRDGDAFRVSKSIFRLKKVMVILFWWFLLNVREMWI